MPDRQVDTVTVPGSATSQAVELPNLDLLRAFAVLAVVTDHGLTMVAASLGFEVTPFVWHLGRVGVLMFFVHTSLVLMQSMARTPLDGWRLFANFYTRRAFRLYPLSVLCILTVLVLGVPHMPWEAPAARTVGGIVSNLLLMNNLTRSEAVLGPLWSLPYELQMYALLPFLFLVTRRMPFMAVAAGLWILSLVVGVVQPIVPGASRLDVARYGPCFLAGVVAYVGLLRAVPRLPAWTWPVAVLGLMGAYVGLSLATGAIHSPWLGWGFCAVLGALIPCARQIHVPFLVRSAHLVARYSYGVYLFHLIGLWIAFAAVPHSVATATGLALLITVAASVSTYHAIERPCITLGGRVARRLVSRGAVRERHFDPTQVPASPAS